jgi:thiamine monophosphate kinase
VTDGLGKDLPALLPPATAGSLILDQLPFEPAIETLAPEDRLLRFFNDGEDYELLFSLDASRNPAEFAASWKGEFPQTRLSHIGWILDSIHPGFFLNHDTGQPLGIKPGGGYQHLQT